ncbi:hypothetical protein STAS_19187 [Striga asiatica]|uniref:DUF1995 domain-containing protein n=1 Tax=Striga asiatica TaxID=4170 RepID=A0A5A7QEL4_STRAF|nr:hypothetical protein STAS_19187 [Striga asiatica]
MATKILQIPVIYNLKQTSTFSLSISFSTPQYHHPKSTSIPPKCTLPKPPATKEEAILQAKTSLLSALEKNPKKLKKIKQPRFRVEIPVTDDSPNSLSELALQVFDEMPMRRKGQKTKFLLLWGNKDLTQAAVKAFGCVSWVQNVDITSSIPVDDDILSADVAVFMAPEASRLAVMKTVGDCLYPKPLVILNSGWSFEEEIDLGGFAGSFHVIYSFMGLVVRGIFSSRKGAIFKCARDTWHVFVEEDGELRAVSSFKSRPSMPEVENVLYNLMAVNSPVTKSARFLRDLVSNVIGRNK